jgi:hypothetical protein
VNTGARWFVPRWFVLQERKLPSTLTVTNLHDSGPGSLRYELPASVVAS